MAFTKRPENSSSECLEQELQFLKASMPPAFIGWDYALKEDWSGDPSIFFYITLSDEASKRGNLRRIAAEISGKISESIQPLDRYGLNAYFHFRSQSEQAILKEISIR
jgi:hypothetical protein